MATVHDRLKAALEQRGWTEDTGHRSSKYTAMRRTVDNARTFPQEEFNRAVGERFFIGRMGALRWSITGHSTRAARMSKTKARLLDGRPSVRADAWDVTEARRERMRDLKAKLQASAQALEVSDGR